MGALTLIDGVMDDQPWSAGAGLVQLVGFAALAWLYQQLGRDLDPEHRVDEDVVLFEPLPLAAFTLTLLTFFGLVMAIAAVLDGASSWWVLPPALVMVASFVALRRFAAAHRRQEAEET